jgi:hypothetical protein
MPKVRLVLEFDNDTPGKSAIEELADWIYGDVDLLDCLGDGFSDTRLSIDVLDEDGTSMDHAEIGKSSEGQANG